MLKSIFLTLITILFLFASTSCHKEKSYVKSEGIIWNTLYHITFQGPEELMDSIIPVLNKVSKSLSVFDKESLVNELNSSDHVAADENLILIYDTSKKINDISKGHFDPTVSPLVDAWGFGIGHTPSRDTLAVDSILQFIGIDKTYRDGNIIWKKDKRTRFNFSAIAKGYGCDAVGEMFKRNSVDNYMIEIGGELSLKGLSPSGQPWRIAIDAPKDNILPGDETALILSLSNMGIATSGNYRNYRIEEGKKMAHTISPQTGHPIISEILSATIIAPTCMEADAYATACMAGTCKEAQSIIQSGGVEGMLILSDSIWYSPGFKNYILSENLD